MMYNSECLTMGTQTTGEKLLLKTYAIYAKKKNICTGYQIATDDDLMMIKLSD